MKKTLLTLSLIMAMASGKAQQNLFSESFAAQPAGWSHLDNDSPSAISAWEQGSGHSMDPSIAPTDPEFSKTCAAVYTTGDPGSISDWLFSPSITVQNGDVVSFYTRTSAATTPGTKQYPDRFQMLIGQSIHPIDPVGATGLGAYTVVVDVNPTWSNTGYPTTWTPYTYTVTGMPTPTACVIAFRYFIDDTATKGDYVGLKTFSVDRPAALGTQDFFVNNFSLQPNPVKDVFSLTSKNGTMIGNVQVVDMNGRVVNEVNALDVNVQVNIADLTTGVYLVKVQSEQGIGTYKIVKK